MLKHCQLNDSFSYSQSKQTNKGEIFEFFCNTVVYNFIVVSSPVAATTIIIATFITAILAENKLKKFGCRQLFLQKKTPKE